VNTTLAILGGVGLISLVSFAGILILTLKNAWLRRVIPFFVPLAIGAFLGDAFFHLIPEAFEESEETLAISFLLIAGVLSFFILEKFLRWHHHDSWNEQPEEFSHAENKKHLGKLVLISDGFHNAIDGIIIGVSFLAGTEIGIATTIAVILHEIPQEIGDFGVLLHAGYSKSAALLYNFISALSAFAGAILVIVIGGASSEKLVTAIVPFAAGVFIYIASADLVPELHTKGGTKNFIYQVAGIGIGVCAMYALLFLE